MSSTEVDNLWSQLRSTLAAIKWDWRDRLANRSIERHTIRVNIRIHTAQARVLRRQLAAVGALA